MCHSNPPPNVVTAIKMVVSVLASTCYASHTAVHRTLRVSPGVLVFGRDMLLPIPVLNDYNLIWEWRQTLIDHMAAQENWHYQFKDYEVGDEVFICAPNTAGLDHCASSWQWHCHNWTITQPLWMNQHPSFTSLSLIILWRHSEVAWSAWHSAIQTTDALIRDPGICPGILPGFRY
jgi:hypothetical protein